MSNAGSGTATPELITSTRAHDVRPRWRERARALARAAAAERVPPGLLGVLFLMGSLGAILWRETGAPGFGFLPWAVVRTRHTVAHLATLAWQAHWIALPRHRSAPPIGRA